MRENYLFELNFAGSLISSFIGECQSVSDGYGTGDLAARVQMGVDVRRGSSDLASPESSSSEHRWQASGWRKSALTV